MYNSFTPLQLLEIFSKHFICYFEDDQSYNLAALKVTVFLVKNNLSSYIKISKGNIEELEEIRYKWGIRQYYSTHKYYLKFTIADNVDPEALYTLMKIKHLI